MTGFVYKTTEQGHRYLDDMGDFLWGPKYRDREFTRRGVGFLSCIHCGRDTSRQGNSQGVCISGGGRAIVHPADYDEFDHQGGDMGWFPVGSECIKQVPAEYRLANPYDDKIKGV